MKYKPHVDLGFEECLSSQNPLKAIIFLSIAGEASIE